MLQDVFMDAFPSFIQDVPSHVSGSVQAGKFGLVRNPDLRIESRSGRDQSGFRFFVMLP